MEKHSYVFDAGNRSILAEIFLPKRISLQGTLYETLEDGLNYEKVKKYLVNQAVSLKSDYLKAYAEWFDATRYGYIAKPDTPVFEDDAMNRVHRCKRVFFGWSTYEVSGVFLKKDLTHIDEEQTQVIRIVFKYDVDDDLKDAESEKYPEVLRAILYWVVSTYGLTDGKVWSQDKFKQFVERFPHWNDEQKAYATKHFVPVANDINIWIDDCGIFIFGFVLHKLWNKIVEMNEEGKRIEEENKKKKIKNKNHQPAPRKRAHLEDEIWVTSIFRYDINVSRIDPNKTENGTIVSEPSNTGDVHE